MDSHRKGQNQITHWIKCTRRNATDSAFWERCVKVRFQHFLALLQQYLIVLDCGLTRDVHLCDRVTNFGCSQSLWIRWFVV